MRLTDEQSDYLRAWAIDAKTTAGLPALGAAITAALSTIDAQRKTRYALEAELTQSRRISEDRIAALEAELDRWRHGAPIEGDFVCPDSLRAAALEVENARLRGSIKHAHGCLLDAGVTMPGDPLAGVSDGIAALEDAGREQERARIIAMMLAEADALAGRVDSDITTYSGAVALRRLAELLGKEAAK